jgi:hypothetical protein
MIKELTQHLVALIDARMERTNKKYFTPHKPCRECPFRENSAPGYFGSYTAQDYLAIAHGDGIASCHMTLDAGIPERSERHCTGIALYRAAVCKTPMSKAAHAHQRKVVAKYGLKGILGYAQFRLHHRVINKAQEKQL